MVEARESHRPLATLDSALRIIRGESLEKWQKENQPTEAEAMRLDLRTRFSFLLRELSGNELFVLHRDFADPLWPQMERRVRNRVEEAIDDACDACEGALEWDWIERAKAKLNVE